MTPQKFLHELPPEPAPLVRVIRNEYGNYEMICDICTVGKVHKTLGSICRSTGSEWCARLYKRNAKPEILGYFENAEAGIDFLKEEWRRRHEP